MGKMPEYEVFEIYDGRYLVAPVDSYPMHANDPRVRGNFGDVDAAWVHAEKLNKWYENIFNQVA